MCMSLTRSVWLRSSLGIPRGVSQLLGVADGVRGDELSISEDLDDDEAPTLVLHCAGTVVFASGPPSRAGRRSSGRRGLDWRLTLPEADMPRETQGHRRCRAKSRGRHPQLLQDFPVRGC